MKRCRNRSRVVAPSFVGPSFVAPSFVALALVALAGCSGGGSGGGMSAPVPKSPTPAPSTTPSGANRTLATAVAHIIIPPKPAKSTARRRRPEWVSPSTYAIQIISTRSDGFAQTNYQVLTTTSSDCTTGSGGSLDCSVPFQAPATTGAQTDSFAVTLLDAPIAYGSILCYGLSTGNTVTSGGVNSFTLTLGGVIGAISLPESTYTVDLGTASNLSIAPTIADADGNAIAGPFDAPATVTLTGAGLADFSLLTPASGSIANPLTDLDAGSIVVHYDGGGTTGSAVTLVVSSDSTLTVDDIGSQATASATITI